MYCQPFRTVLASDFWFLVSEIMDSVSAEGAIKIFEKWGDVRGQADGIYELYALR
jgi:hypothetical protein